MTPVAFLLVSPGPVDGYPPVQYQARLLADAGWRPGSDGILARDGHPFRFDVIFPPDTWSYDFEALAQQFNAGINTDTRDVAARPREVAHVSSK